MLTFRVKREPKATETIFPRDTLALDVGPFLGGLISISATLVPILYESNDYTLEVQVKNEGTTPLKNFSLIAEASAGVKMTYKDELFGMAFIQEKIGALLPRQKITYRIKVSLRAHALNETLTISAKPQKESPLKSHLVVQLQMASAKSK
jgi:hypothetical protein